MEVQVYLPDNFPDLLKDAVAAVLEERLRASAGTLDNERVVHAAMAGLGPVRRVIVTTDEQVIVFEADGEDVHVLDDSGVFGSRDGPIARLLPEDERLRLLGLLDEVGVTLPTDNGRGSERRVWRQRSPRPRRSGLDRRRSVRGLVGNGHEQDGKPRRA